MRFIIKSIFIIFSTMTLIQCQDESIEISSSCNIAKGEIYITEIMANPSSGPEWIELFNASTREINLSRAVLKIKGSGSPRTLIIEDRQLTPAEYFVISDTLAPFVNYQTPSALRIPNNLGQISIECNATGVDEVNYDTSSILYSDQAGLSFSTDGALELPTEKVDRCSTQPSPGKKNEYCGINRCISDTILNISPQSGPIINEIFTNPMGVDKGLEWLELYNTSTNEIILNGIIINNFTSSTSRQWIIKSANCLIMPGNSYWTIGFNSIKPQQFDIMAEGNQDLLNSQSSFQLWQQEVLIDFAEIPDSTQGRSLVLSPDLMNSIDNDLPGSYCNSTSNRDSLNPNDIASPGLPNDMCL